MNPPAIQGPEYIDGKNFIQADLCTFEQAKNFKTEVIWQNLASKTVEEAKNFWLGGLSRLTAKNYKAGMHMLENAGLIKPSITLQVFSLVNHNEILDRIKTLPGLTESTKQARAACYISFTRFLSRRTNGIIAQAIPSREGATKTFYKVREKVATEAMTAQQWHKFLDELSNINKRDCLIAKIILQGCKRVNEALSLTVDAINFDKREITFAQSKTKGFEKYTVITYPQTIIGELKECIGDRKGLVFITNHGKRILPYQLNITFLKAGQRADIPFRVHPHVLRASAITVLKLRGYNDSEIQKMSGHATSAQVFAYDKGDRSINPSKYENLIL